MPIGALPHLLLAWVILIPSQVQKFVTLDIITIGRSSVDLYGGQIGGRLEDNAKQAKGVTS